MKFAYEGENSRLLFDNLNLHIEPHSWISIVGESGIGKTTIGNMLVFMHKYYKSLDFMILPKDRFY